MPSPKILIVEDDPFSVQLLRHNLKKYNAELLPVATTAEEALKIALEYEPDVALVDIYLTEAEDGLQAAKAIQENFDIPIIYLTGYTSEEVFESAKATDPFGYILKPFTPKELTVTLDMALYKHAVSKELKQSKSMLATTLGALHEAVITTDADWNILYANKVAQRWLGVDVGTQAEKYLQLRVPQTDEVIPFDPTLFDKAQGPVCKIRVLDGSHAYVRLTVVEQPRPANGYVIALWDVTAEYEGQKDAQSVFAALESLEEGLLILHPHTEKVIFASKGFETMTGWGAKDVQGEVAHFLFGAKTSSDFWKNVKEGLRDKGYVKAESILYTKDGRERMAQWQISRMKPTHAHDDGQLIVFLRDVSDQRQLEEDLRQSQKIEAVGRLAGGVAHDFNNMLSVINSYADLLTLKLPEGDPLVKYVSNIRTAGQRAAELVSKLLTFSRRDNAKPSLLDVKSVTDDIYKMLRRVIREDIEIKLEFSDQLMAVWADQLQLEQVLMNLCVNARDAITDSGTIYISWGMTQVNNDLAEKKKIEAGNYLSLTVRDTGCGMSADVLQRIFEPYFTTKASGKGTGLGLSIVYAIAKQLKGCVEVESTEGKGTAFRLLFPASEKPARSHSQAPVVVEPMAGNEHILVVEDEESFAECLQSLLSLHGYKVHHAKDAATALQIYEQSIYPIKLLISDMVLPGISGKELAKQLKAKNEELKVVFITGYDNAVNVLHDFPYTALVLQKPFSVVSILNKVREVLDNPQGDKKIQIV